MKTYNKIKSFVLYAVAAGLISPRAGFAAININITGPTGVLCTIATDMFWILITLSTIMVLYAAFIYMTAGENSQNVSKAHKIIAYAAVGIIVALLAKNFPVIISSIVGGTLPAGSTC